MGRKLIYAILSIVFLLCSCIEKEEISPSSGLVLDFALEGKTIAKADGDTPVSFEDKVTHLDVFFFDNSNAKFHYERIMTDGNSSGEKAITGITLTTLQDICTATGGSVKIYVVANSKLPVSTLQEVSSKDALIDLKEETTYINLTGYTGFDYDIPMTFLMTGLATLQSVEALPDESNYQGIDFSDITTTENYKLKVRLVRAAAKLEMHFKKNNNSGHIYAFGLPKIYETGNVTENQLGNITLSNFSNPEDFSYIHNSYYVRNLRYFTHLWGSNDDISEKRKTNPITNSGYMTAVKTGVQNADNSVDGVKVTAYIYSYSWGGSDQSESIFESAPFLIVNLPCIIYTDGDTKSKGRYVERNYYEIPFRTKKNENEGKFTLKRNHYYKITAEVDAPGAQTSMEPVLLEPVYYEVYPWNECTVDIGGETTGVKYLSLSTNAIEMHNTTTSSEIKFASSSPIKEVRLVRAYYVNKAGKEIEVTNPTATATANALNGTVTVNSVYPNNVDNVIMYMTFEVINQDNSKQSFTVKQYPTVYIEGILGYFSYRTDFGETDFLNYGSNGIIAANWSNNGWSYNNNYDRNNTYKTFNSKAAGTNFNNDGHVSMNYYYWSRSGNKYQIKYYTSISHYLNPRMYQVTITTTSEDYKLGRPQLDRDGFTDSSAENNGMVSPSFMIASGLGATQAMTNANAAKTHCGFYAETYKDENGNVVRLEDWRLPTTAEIAIIAKFQKNSVAMDVVLTGNKYWSASGNAVETGVAGDTGDPKVRCVRDVYTPSQTKTKH